MDAMRERYTTELAEAAKGVRTEAPPEPSSIWDYVFADKNYVAPGESLRSVDDDPGDPDGAPRR